MDKKLQWTITLKNYIRKVKLSEKRRALYYEKGGKKKPPKYAVEPNYIWRKLNGKERLFSVKKDEFVIRNSRTAGKPRYKNINSQYLYDSSVNQHVRAKMMDGIKDFFRPTIIEMRDLMKETGIRLKYPLILDGEICDDFIDEGNTTGRWDVENRQGMYVKAIMDLLIEEGVIIDDDRQYVTKPLSFIFTPSDTRMMRIWFYQDTRPEITSSQYYKDLNREVNVNEKAF